MQTINGTMTVGQLVLERPSAARVLRGHHIDFCCGGQRTLAQVCAEKQLPLDALIAELEADAPSAVRGDDVATMPTSALLGYIVERHHTYLRKNLPWVQQMAAKVARVHGEHNAKLKDLDMVVQSLAEDLLQHLDEEEESLFPLLLDAAGDKDRRARELSTMDADHHSVGAMLERIRELTEEYLVPEWGCGSYRALFTELKTMEADIHQHVHLENNVVVPRFRAQ